MSLVVSHGVVKKTIRLGWLCAWLLVSACASSTAVLRVTPEHRTYLNAADDSKYSNGEIRGLFNELSVRGDAICDMIYERKPFDDKVAYAFSNSLNFRRPPRQEWFNNVVPSLIAGCFNFFRMNDRGVNRIFQLLEQLYPETKDCYTVGFSQYYMMVQEMRCQRYVSADADWRILKAHYDFHELTRADNPTNETLALMRQIELGWVARFDIKPLPREPVKDENTFCMETERKECLRAFNYFTRQTKVGRTELMLGFIHDLRFAPKDSGLSIVFVSNGLDWEYTSEVQFEKLHRGIRENLPKGKRIALVYQAGDSEDIAVYEFLKTDADELNISIRCRDSIRWSDRYKEAQRGKPYDTWFDELLQYRQQPNIPRCHRGGTRNYQTAPPPPAPQPPAENKKT